MLQHFPSPVSMTVNILVNRVDMFFVMHLLQTVINEVVLHWRSAWHSINYLIYVIIE